MDHQELERRIAERIMGWMACRVDGDSLVGHPPDSAGTESELQPVPQYARYLLDAWAVVDEMYRGGYSCQVSLAQILATPTAEFAKGKHHVVETAQTVPEAICLAALAVIELEKKAVRGKAHRIRFTPPPFDLRLTLPRPGVSARDGLGFYG